MHSFQLSVPSKTFLLGEYAVLRGDGGIVLTTAPRFTLWLTPQDAGSVSGIHPDSPAGKLIKQTNDIFDHYHVNFVDAHQGRGGFGASGAQFLMVAAFIKQMQGIALQEDTLLKEYESFAWNGIGVPPSGVDLIAQWHGGICYFHKAKKQLKTLSWPFQELDYCVIHTGTKLATHDHLKNLTEIDTTELEKIVTQGLHSMEQKNSQLFIEVILNYATALNSKQLVAEHTKTILEQLSSCDDILAAKGCGALGADVIFVLFMRNNQHVIHWLENKKFNIITHGHAVAQGLRMSEELKK